MKGTGEFFKKAFHTLKESSTEALERGRADSGLIFPSKCISAKLIEFPSFWSYRNRANHGTHNSGHRTAQHTGRHHRRDFEDDEELLRRDLDVEELFGREYDDFLAERDFSDDLD